MLYLNYNGLTYRWAYTLGVEVLDGKVAVDHFTLGYSDLGPPSYSDFLEGVAHWDTYINEWRETEDNLSDVEADAMTLASAGWGTDEDYDYSGEDY